MSEEEWRPVVGFESLYDVSSAGNVRSRCRRWSKNEHDPISPGVMKVGYRIVRFANLHGKGKQRQATYKVADLVAAAFIGPKPSGHVVNHLDGVKGNDAATNLEYTTPKGNTVHAWEMGLTPQAPVMRGEANPRAKITKLEALCIMASLAEGDRVCEIAREYGTTWDTVNQIKRGATWRHLNKPSEASEPVA